MSKRDHNKSVVVAVTWAHCFFSLPFPFQFSFSLASAFFVIALWAILSFTIILSLILLRRN